MDLKVFVPKTPVNLSAQIQRDVTNGNYTGATLVDENDQRHYYTTGFHVDDLEDLGLTDESQFAQLRAMDDAGSIDLVTFESDPDHIGFLITEDLHTVIMNGSEDLKKLTTIPWNIYEIQHPSSESPYKGSLKPVRDSQGHTYRIDFVEISEYFKHIVETGHLSPEDRHVHEEDLPVVTKPKQTSSREFTDEELSSLIDDQNFSGEDMKMNVEEKQSEEDRLLEQGDKYYKEQLKKEEERRKQEEARRRREAERQKEARARQARNKQKNAIPQFKRFEDIVQELGVHPDSRIQSRYLSQLEDVNQYAKSMKIVDTEFNQFDEQGRRDLMIAMNREREKFVNQALVQLKREALDVEEKVDISNNETVNAGIAEKYDSIFIRPLEQLRNDIPKAIDDYETERENILEDGYNQWLQRVEEDPRAVYEETYRQSVVDDAVQEEKDRQQEIYNRALEQREKEFDQYVDQFVEERHTHDLSYLKLDWEEASRQGAQTLNERIMSARDQMESRRMVTEMRRMYEQIEQQTKAQQQPLPRDVQPSTSMQQEGTVQQEQPIAQVQSPSAPEPKVETPAEDTAVRSVPDDTVSDDVVSDNNESVSNADKPAVKPEEAAEAVRPQQPKQNQSSTPQPVVSRPTDIYPEATSNTADEWDDEDELNEWDDEDLTGDVPDELADDDWDDDFDDLDDLDLDVEDEKPRKKGLRGLFGKR